MHPRGAVTFPNGEQRTRGSVWIEQEIAIAAFLTQILERNLGVLAYVHEDVSLEGMRDKLQSNPARFRTNADVVSHLRTSLPAWQDQIAPALQALELVLEAEGQAAGQYQLVTKIVNRGSTAIDDYTLGVFFPKCVGEPGHPLRNGSP
jgi:hypothetical protein